MIRGETTHYDHICAESARGLQDLAVREGLAIGYGILTFENEAQALARAAARGPRPWRGGGARLPGDRRVEAAPGAGRRMNAADDHTTGDGRPRLGGRRRTVARLAAVQALYQLELNPELDAEAVVREFARYRLGQEIDGDQLAEADAAFFSRHRARRDRRSGAARRSTFRRHWSRTGR